MADPLLSIALRGELDKKLRADAAAFPRAVRAGILVIARGARRELLQGVRGSGRVNAKDRAIGLAAPRINQLRGGEPFARVFSRLLMKGGRSQPRVRPVDLLAVFDRSATITASRSDWLAVPTKMAPMKWTRGGTRPLTPTEAEYDAGFKLVFRPISHNRAILTSPGTKGNVYYVLIRQAYVRKRVDIAGTVQRWSRRMPLVILEHIDREQRRIQRRYAA